MKLFFLVIGLFCAFIPNTLMAACEESTTLQQLLDASVRGEKAFGERDPAQLLTQASLARTKLLPCLGETLAVADAAAFHRLMAMEAFINDDDSRVLAEFHASRKLESVYHFPEARVKSEHRLMQFYDQSASLADGEPEPVYPPAGGYAMVAGVRNAPRYSQTPVVIQVFAKDDLLIETVYVQPGQILPRWSENPFGLTMDDIAYRRPFFTDPLPWYVASGVGAVASGVLYAIAKSQQSNFLDSQTPDEELQGFQDRANRLGALAIISFGTSVAFSGAGVTFQMTFGPHEAFRFTPRVEAHAHVP